MIMQMDVRKVSSISMEIFKQIETVENNHDASTAATPKAVERWGPMVVRVIEPCQMGREASEVSKKCISTHVGDEILMYVTLISLDYVVIIMLISRRLVLSTKYGPHQRASHSRQNEQKTPPVGEIKQELKEHERVHATSNNISDSLTELRITLIDRTDDTTTGNTSVMVTKTEKRMIKIRDSNRTRDDGREMLPFRSRLRLTELASSQKLGSSNGDLYYNYQAEGHCSYKPPPPSVITHQPKSSTNQHFQPYECGYPKTLESLAEKRAHHPIYDNVRNAEEKTNVQFISDMTSNMKKFVLVFWVKGKDTSIMSMAETGRDLSKGDKLRLPFGGRSYLTKVLEVSEDEKWLRKINVSEDGDIIYAKKKENKKKKGTGRKQKSAARVETERVMCEKLLQDNSSSKGDSVVSCQERAPFIPSDTDEDEQPLRSGVGQRHSRKEKHPSERASSSKEFRGGEGTSCKKRSLLVSSDEDDYADRLEDNGRAREIEVSHGGEPLRAKKQEKNQKRGTEQKKKNAESAETAKVTGEKLIEDSSSSEGDNVVSCQQRVPFIPSDTDEDEQPLRSGVGQQHSRKEKHQSERASSSKEFRGGEGISCKKRSLFVSSDEDDYADRLEDNERAREIKVFHGGEALRAKKQEKQQKRGAKQKKKNAASEETAKVTGENLIEDNSSGEGDNVVYCQERAPFIPSDTDEDEQPLCSRVGQEQSRKEKHHFERSSSSKNFGGREGTSCKKRSLSVSSDDDDYAHNLEDNRRPREIKVSDGGVTEVSCQKRASFIPSDTDEDEQRQHSRKKKDHSGPASPSKEFGEVSRRKRPLLMHSDDEDDKQPRRSKVVLLHGGKENDDPDKTSVTKEAGSSEEMLEPIIAKIMKKLVKDPKVFPKASESSVDPRPSTSRHYIDLPQDDDELKEHPRTRRNAVEIQPESGVFVDRTELQLLSTRWKTNPKMLARKLMLDLVGAAKLKESTALGTGKKDGIDGRMAIPSHILDAVKYYIDQRCVFKLSPADYNRAITLQCGTLRNPRKSSDKKEKGNKKDGSQDADSE